MSQPLEKRAIDRLGELASVALADRWQVFFDIWELVRQIRTDSSYGTLLLCKPANEPDGPFLLVKMAKEVCEEMRHEAIVADDIKELVVPSCPMFMTVDFHCDMPWTFHPDLWGKPQVSRYVLFFRAAECRLAIGELCRKFWYDTPLVMSQGCHTLMAFHQAQKRARFTHYDPHLYNILEQPTNCQWVLYRTLTNNGTSKNVLLPTYGFLPFVIDYGKSHSVSVGKKAGNIWYSYWMQHFKYGMQTAVFDPLFDAHFFLIRLLRYNDHEFMSIRSDEGDDEENESSDNDESTDDEGDEDSGSDNDESNDRDESSEDERGDEGNEDSNDECDERKELFEIGPPDDEWRFVDYRPTIATSFHDQVLQSFKNLPVNSKSGDRILDHDFYETIDETIDERVPEKQLNEFWLWMKWAPMVLQQLSALMPPLPDWSDPAQVPKNKLSLKGLEGVIDGVPIHKSFVVVMQFLTRWLPKQTRKDQRRFRREGGEGEKIFIGKYRDWYMSVLAQWILCVRQAVEKGWTQDTISKHMKSTLLELRLFQPAVNGYRFNWGSLDWRAAAVHTQKLAQGIWRICEALLRRHMEAIQEFSKATPVTEPIDLVLQFLPQWINGSDLPVEGDRILVSDSVEGTHYEIILGASAVPDESVPWIDMGDSLWDCLHAPEDED